MRAFTYFVLALAAAALAVAQPVTKNDAQRAAAQYNGPKVKVSGYIWTDKVTYMPGDSLTLKTTLTANGDLYPYTSFLYIQDNQTGVKKYWPAMTETPTDVLGNTAEQGFQPIHVQDATKQTVVGAGGAFPALTIPNEPGMHTIVAELRDYTGGKVLKANYIKFGVVTSVKTLTQPITEDMTLTNDTEWHLGAIIFVKNGAALTVEPGTFIIGDPPPTLAGLVITREGTIEAHGTQARPIIMTSSKPVGQRNRGDWLGFIMLGKARANLAAGASAGNPEGQGYIEGLQTTDDGLYGGTDDHHYCGTITYVRVEFAGYILSQGNEVNNFTFGGCGDATVAHHLQSSYGLDDTFEWFGGTMNIKFIVGGTSRDDYLDSQLGARFKVQYGVFYQTERDLGNRGTEFDNSEYDAAATPYNHPVVANVTFIGSGEDGYDEGTVDGIFLRRGVRADFYNAAVTRFVGGGFRINDPDTQAQADMGNITVNGLVMWNNNLNGTPAPTIEGQTRDTNSADFLKGQYAKNVFAMEGDLTAPFNYNDPDFLPMFGSPLLRSGWVQMPDDGFFDQDANFIGAFGDVDWTKEWTYWVNEEDIQ